MVSNYLKKQGFVDKADTIQDEICHVYDENSPELIGWLLVDRKLNNLID